MRCWFAIRTIFNATDQLLTQTKEVRKKEVEMKMHADIFSKHSNKHTQAHIHMHAHIRTVLNETDQLLTQTKEARERSIVNRALPLFRTSHEKVSFPTLPLLSGGLIERKK